jgi:uncharacterized repeat protein (TIGR03803 family)
MTSKAQDQSCRERSNFTSQMGLRAASAMLALAAALVTVAIATPSAQAQTFTTLHSFEGADGASPYAGLVQAVNGSLYGTTGSGGANSGTPGGTIFKITPNGTLMTLYSFCAVLENNVCTDGSNPLVALVQATNGNFYGTTETGGVQADNGTVFEITAADALTTLHSFAGYPTDGAVPVAPLVQATDGNFYGTASFSGASGYGTVFKITPNETLTTLYNFCSQSGCPDGSIPSAGLVQGHDGDLYGTASFGGANGYGTVFKITLTGTLTTLHSFDLTDGAYPASALVQATANGDFYGTTDGGGANQDSSCEYTYCGTVFTITPNGTLTTLYNFCSQSGCTDGDEPFGGLVEGTDGNFYGTALGGGANGEGTAFRITPSSALTTLYNFCSQSGCSDGSQSRAPLVQDTDGTFYGTTSQGGSGQACPSGCGTVFSLSVNLGPFVETKPTSRGVGATVRILGTDLTGATSVSFNGTPAVFTVVSSSEITTTVPANATSGKVQVQTPGGMLSSNLLFRVVP